jgi:large subunit ribosomal protein LP0
MEIKFVFDGGNVLTPEIFNITPTEILNKFKVGANFVAALSLATGIPTVASLPHSIISAFKNLAAISLVTGYKFKQMDALSSGPSQAAGG